MVAGMPVSEGSPLSMYSNQSWLSGVCWLTQSILPSTMPPIPVRAEAQQIAVEGVLDGPAVHQDSRT